ncbi:MAG: Nif3-like dinuclear metal center hexameric protein, partial [Clostridiales Family XIII bacterium]|nr:Nif3-like dinuclear metal center hexameric protein [Clostridiales Family XIII bacterium]
HHPLLFVPVKRIAFNDVTGGYIAALIASGIGAYAAHTSFDSAPGGMNDSLAARIGLVNVAPLPSAAMREEGRDFGAGMMRCGAFDRPLTFREACRRVERVLGMEGRLRVVGDPDKPIERVALCGGGGGDLTEDAIRNDCQLYITGDVKHHQAQWAKESGMCLIDGGHDGTEKHFIEVAANRLREAFSGSLEIIETSVSADPYK